MAQETLPVDEQGKPGALSPPYISFTVFTNCLDWLKSERVVPHRFDRSFWGRKYSGSVGSQLLLALRFLGLLHGEIPQPALEELANADDVERKRLLLDILKSTYKEVDFSQLERATLGMLRGWMSKYSLQSTTQRKAESFLINGLKYAGYVLPPALQKAARNKPPTTATRNKPKTPPTRPKVEPPPLDKIDPQKRNTTTTRMLKLSSGGQVTLEIDVDLFQLSDDDREFVMGLVDAFRDYPVDEEQDEEIEDES